MYCEKITFNPSRPVFALALDKKEARILRSVLESVSGVGEIRYIVDRMTFWLDAAGVKSHPAPPWLSGTITASGDFK